MFLAIAVVLVQPLALPQNAVPQNLIAPVTTLSATSTPSPAAVDITPGAEVGAPAASPAAEPVDAAPASAASAPQLILIREFRMAAAPFAPELAAMQPSRAALAS